MKAKDISGMVFGRLTVTSFAGNRRYGGVSRRFWNCECECGRTVVVVGLSLLGGNTRSCGCLFLETIKRKLLGGKVIHGKSKSPEYRAWISMRVRCEKKDYVRFADYGGRNISVCDRWKNSVNFLDDMGKRPSPDHSLDRIDNNGNYEPSNCRWATRSQQQRNKRKCRTDNKLPKGDDHWTRRDPERALKNITKNMSCLDRKLKNNGNSKMTKKTASEMRRVYKDMPQIKMDQLGKMFGVKRETARKVIKGIAW